MFLRSLSNITMGITQVALVDLADCTWDCYEVLRAAGQRLPLKLCWLVMNVRLNLDYPWFIRCFTMKNIYNQRSLVISAWKKHEKHWFILIYHGVSHCFTMINMGYQRCCYSLGMITIHEGRQVASYSGLHMKAFVCPSC